MPRSVKAATLRDHLSDALDEVSKKVDYLIITKRGRPVLVLVNIDFFEDRLLALASPKYVQSIKEARADYEAGRVVGHEQAFGEL